METLCFLDRAASEDYYRKIAPLIACLKSVYNILTNKVR